MWLQGEDNAPDICKACLASLRYWHPDKKIITLDQSNISDYVTLPDYIERKHNQGIIDNTKYSDLVRLQLLIEYGGTWIDSTVYCTGRSHDEYVMHLPLFVYRGDSPLHPLQPTIPISSWFIVSDPHNPILELTQKLQFKYWEDYDYVIHYFFFHMLFRMAARVYIDEYSKIPFMSNNPPHAMQRAMYDDYSDESMKYLAGVSDFHKMTYKLDPCNMPSERSIYQHVIDSYAH